MIACRASRCSVLGVVVVTAGVPGVTVGAWKAPCVKDAGGAVPGVVVVVSSGSCRN
jgi:hypothetical protein